MLAARDPNKAHRSNATSAAEKAAGSHDLVAQPPTQAEDRGPDAEAAQLNTPQHALGRPGKPLNQRSPFFIGLNGAAGVAVMAGIVEMIITVRGVLVLIGLALFLAIGLEPAVAVLTRRKVPRWAAVITVLAAGVAVVGGFLAAAIPPLARQATSSSPKPRPRCLGY